jgi:Arabinogalactan endo-1,4-beta-galactosidase
LNLLKTNNVTPEWVQVGNETSNGMLWDTGRASMSMANYAALTNAGYDAVKSVFPSAKVIVHINNGYNNSLYQWIFDGLKNNGAKWDVIGMSLYPTWYTTPNDWQNCNISCLANMNNMVARYGKEVMIVECGMSWDSPTACNSFLTDLIAKTKSVTNGMGIGVIYWEPECYSNWSGYSLGAFDNSGKPTAALDAFKSVSGLTAVENPELKAFWDKKTKSILFNFEATNTQLCDASGKYILQIASAGSSLPVGNLQTGVYIVTANRLNENELYKFKVIVN